MHMRYEITVYFITNHDLLSLHCSKIRYENWLGFLPRAGASVPTSRPKRGGYVLKPMLNNETDLQEQDRRQTSEGFGPRRHVLKVEVK